MGTAVLPPMMLTLTNTVFPAVVSLKKTLAPSDTTADATFALPSCVSCEPSPINSGFGLSANDQE